MVDPKKEYELLMRYLQGGALKKEPAVPEPPHPETWTPQPIPAATGPAVVYPKEKKRPVALHPAQKKQWLPRLLWKSTSAMRSLRIAIAAAAIFLLLFFAWKGYYLYQLTSEKIFKELYIPFPTGAQQAAKNSIEQYYAAGNFVAVTLQGKKQARVSDREQLLAGLAHLHRDDYTKAIKWLEPAANNFKSPYRQQAEFYLALAYLKNEDYDRSIERMERITHTPAHPYHDRISERTLRDIKLLKWK